jgi:hypothetical protein
MVKPNDASAERVELTYFTPHPPRKTDEREESSLVLKSLWHTNAPVEQSPHKTSFATFQGSLPLRPHWVLRRRKG